MKKVKTSRDVKTRPLTISKVLSRRITPRTNVNIRHGHLVRGMREIPHIEWEPWEQKVAEILHEVAETRYMQANRFFSALEHIQALLNTARKQREALQTFTEELQTANEELQATNEELQATTEELERTHAYRQAIMYSVRESMIITTTSGIITDVNQATKRISGYSSEELVGQPFSKLFGDPEQAQVGIERAKEEELVNYDLTLVTKDRREIPVNGNFSSVVDSQGCITAMLITLRDMSRIGSLINELEKSNRAKAEFLASMSHQLRTPLNAIIGYVSLLRRERYGNLTDQQAQALTRIEVNNQNLLEMVNTVLDLSKVEANQMPFYSEEVDLGQLIGEVTSTVDSLVRQAGLELKVNVEEGLRHIYTDRLKLKQIILNMASNAIKFTPEGGITVTSQDVPARQQVQIAVTDTGIGIRQEDLGRIFQEFQVIDRERGGTGLGLSISQKFTSLLGGKITVQSVFGQGSTFTLSLPYTVEPRVVQPVVEAPVPEAVVFPKPGYPEHILLAVDDDPDSIAILQSNLEGTGWRVVGASNGKEGLRLARELHPFAITLDILMPEWDGWITLKELKTDPETADIPVVMLSVLEERTTALALGVADYLVKPIEEEVLLKTLARLRQPDQWDALVVDDEPDAVAILRDILTGEGYTVRTSLSGPEAIAEIRHQKPNYLFLDILMPEMSGFDVLDLLHREGELEGITTIIVTAKDLTPQEMDFLSRRAAAIVEKSHFGKEEFVATLRETLQKVVRK